MCVMVPCGLMYSGTFTVSVPAAGRSTAAVGDPVLRSPPPCLFEDRLVQHLVEVVVDHDVEEPVFEEVRDRLERDVGIMAEIVDLAESTPDLPRSVELGEDRELRLDVVPRVLTPSAPELLFLAEAVRSSGRRCRFPSAPRSPRTPGLFLRASIAHGPGESIPSAGARIAPAPPRSSSGRVPRLDNPGRCPCSLRSSSGSSFGGSRSPSRSCPRLLGQEVHRGIATEFSLEWARIRHERGMCGTGA